MSDLTYEGEAITGDLDWRRYAPGQSSLNGVPTTPGIVRLLVDAEGQQFLVRDVRAWLMAMREDLHSDSERRAPSFVEWCSPPMASLEQIVADPRRASALTRGRPRRVRSLSQVPLTWGVYRIHRKADDAWYVGISSNLRARLGAHSSAGMFDLSAGYEIDLILAKADPDRPVVWADLQREERKHIRVLRERGLNVVNATAGGNARPPDNRINLAESQLALAGAPTSPLRQPRRGHIDLAIRLLGRDRDYDLWLREDDVICGVAGSHMSPSMPADNELDWSDLITRYRTIHGRDLEEDLEEFQRQRPRGSLKLLYWHGKDAVGFLALYASIRGWLRR